MPTRPIREMLERDRRVVRAGPESTVHAAARLMAENGCGSILVMEGERLLGIFTERDLLTRVAAAGKSLERTHLREVMTRNPDTVRADEPVKEAIRKMDEFSYRYLPVLEDGRVIGVISTRHLPFGEVLALQWELDERHAVAERLW
jgi:CBS domain-containing protein